MELRAFQQLIDQTYGARDRARGSAGTFMYLMEEVGELATALREGTPEEQAAEFADVYAWLTTLATLHGVDVQAAIERKYGAGCSVCGQLPCACQTVKP